MKEELLCIYNGRLVDSEIDSLGAIFIQNGKIQEIFLGNFLPDELSKQISSLYSVEKEKIFFIDANEMVVQPSFIDMHTHSRYPGQAEKEELITVLAAAVAGGYGGLVFMPNTNPVISSFEQAKQIQQEAQNFGLTSVFQSISLTKNFNGTDTSHLDELKAYEPGFVDNSILLATEDGKDVLDSAVMFDSMQKCAKKNILVSCHSEDCSLAIRAKPLRMAALEILAQKNLSESQKKQAWFFLQQANEILSLAENIATERNIQLAAGAMCPVHIAHVSTAKSLESVVRAKSKNQSVTCEVTPHHLALSVKQDDEELRHIVNPPLRSEDQRQALLQGIINGTVDAIATDHAPHTLLDKKSGSPGFSGIETAYAVCNETLVQSNFISYSRLSSLMAGNPAKILGLDKGLNPKGFLRKGFSADIVICNPKETWTVASENFKSKGKYTPLEGKTLMGKVHKVFFQGQCVYSY